MVHILKKWKKAKLVHETKLHERDENILWRKECEQIDGALVYYWHYGSGKERSLARGLR